MSSKVRCKFLAKMTLISKTEIGHNRRIFEMIALKIKVLIFCFDPVPK